VSLHHAGSPDVVGDVDVDRDHLGAPADGLCGDRLRPDEHDRR
jgi:hypothetical protein